MLTSLLVLFFSLLWESESRWILEVKLHHYINPTSQRRVLSNSGQFFNQKCCDNFGSDCSNPCDNIFTFCLRLSTDPGCQDVYGIYETGLVTGGDNLTFTDGELIGENAVPNPLIFTGMQWPDNNQLCFITNIEDQDVFFDEEVDEISTCSTLPYAITSDHFSNIMTLRGTVITGIHLQVSYNMSCDQYYYGSRCDVFCQSRYDNTGHYTCHSEGNQICNSLPNESNCTRLLCQPVCNYYQQCVSPNSCVCRDGMTGTTTCDVQCIECTSTVTAVTSINTNAVSPTSISTNAVSSPTNVASSNTTTAIIGSMVALLVTIAVVVSVIVMTLFVLMRRKNIHLKKSQDTGHSLDNPNYVHTPSNELNEVFTMRNFENPIYELSSNQGTHLPNSNTDTQTVLAYSDDIEPQNGYSEGVYSYSGPPEAIYTQINKQVASPGNNN